ncbi:MAG: NAD-dependent epimerase/dehydratase family protein [Proteobacteria bacterium]|nr:NAD-dependent epimerase/dehydratase family protein [Pseudomonadota bacterium]
MKNQVNPVTIADFPDTTEIAWDGNDRPRGCTHNGLCNESGDVFGPGDDFDPDNSHVIAALLKRTHEAKTAGDQWVEIWGTGTPRREFLHIDDLAGEN